jgi:hypothetical protein
MRAKHQIISKCRAQVTSGILVGRDLSAFRSLDELEHGEIDFT